MVMMLSYFLKNNNDGNHLCLDTCKNINFVSVLKNRLNSSKCIDVNLLEIEFDYVRVMLKNSIFEKNLCTLPYVYYFFFF